MAGAWDGDGAGGGSINKYANAARDWAKNGGGNKVGVLPTKEVQN